MLELFVRAVLQPALSEGGLARPPGGMRQAEGDWRPSGSGCWPNDVSNNP